MFARPGYRIWISQRGGQVVAFAVVHAASTHSIALLEYLAVHPGLQGLGIGRRLLEHILSVLRGAHRTVLVEVESDKLPALNPSLRSRRKQFYRSFGAREITGLHYLMPQVSTGMPPPMDLLLVSAEASPSEPRQTIAIEKQTLHAWLTTIYVEVYDQSPADPRLTAMLAGLPDDLTLL